MTPDWTALVLGLAGVGVALSALHLTVLVVASLGAHAIDIPDATDWTLAATLVTVAGLFGGTAWWLRAGSLPILGGLTALPMAWCFVGLAVDRLLAFPGGELTRFSRVTSILFAAVALGLLISAALILAARFLALHLPRGVRVVGALVTALAAGGLLVAVATPPVPRWEAWDDFRVRWAQPRALHEDADGVVAVDPPMGLARAAYLVRLPPVGTSREEVPWRGPHGLTLRLRGPMVTAGRVGCRADERVALVIVSDAGTTVWVPDEHCFIAGERGGFWDGLRSSEVPFSVPLGAPRACGVLLLVGVLVGGGLGVLGMRVRRRRRRIASLAPATVLDLGDGGPASAQLDSGAAVRLAGAGSIAAAHVFVARTAGPAEGGFRTDARPSADDWLVSAVDRATALGELDRVAGLLDALGLLGVLWLALPALYAWCHGLAVSVW